MANTVAENQTNESVHAGTVFDTHFQETTRIRFMLRFVPGKRRIAAAVASVGIGESNAAGTLCQVSCFPVDRPRPAGIVSPSQPSIAPGSGCTVIGRSIAVCWISFYVHCITLSRCTTSDR